MCSSVLVMVMFCTAVVMHSWFVRAGATPDVPTFVVGWLRLFGAA